jgi:hypothetical protein
MMNNNYNIVSYDDLVREEIRVKKRLTKQEEQIKVQLQTLPEEIVTTGVTKIVSGILSGNLFKSAFSIIKTLKISYLTKFISIIIEISTAIKKAFKGRLGRLIED